MEAELLGDAPALVPPGEYLVMLDWFRTVTMFKAPKLELVFTIVSHGPHYGTRLSRYYNIDRIIGKPQKGGRFKVGRNRDFTREFCSLFHHTGNRLDRLPMTRFDGATLKASVVTVKQARGQHIPKALQYSKIDQLIKVVEHA